MNQRERFLTTINRGIPDRPPIVETLTAQTAKKLSDAIGVPYEEPYDSLLSTRMSHMDLLTTLGNDAIGVAACAQHDRPTRKTANGFIENEWGMVFKDIGLYSEFIEFPLAHAETKTHIEEYDFPDPHGEGRYDVARQNIAKYQPTHG